MHWAFILAATVGLLLGFRFKVYAIAAGSATILLGGTVFNLTGGWSFGWAFLAAFGSMFAFQCGYFLGLSLMCLAQRQPLRARREEAEPSR